MKKLLKTRKFYMLSAILLSIVGVIVFFISNALSNKGSIEFKAYTGYYESDQHPITDIVNSEDGKPYYSIKNFYDNFDTWSKSSTGNVTPNPTGFNSDEYIGIDDMTDLVAFSRLCNPDFNNSSYTSFLGYKYILTNNITTTSSSLYFMPIGTDSEHPFSGEFNGNGYDITNMSFVNIQNTGETDHFKENYPNTQEKIQYFAMFSNNKGTICNFGIINANLSFNYSSNGQFYKVAMICGENQAGGTINKVYVRDLRDADNKRAGIMPFGGYTISGLVFSNKGTVSNSYVAYSTVVNGAVDDFSDFSELIYENSGNESNLFFYNDAITKIGTSETYEGAQSFESSVEIVYSSLGMQVKRTVYGTYCQKLEYLDIAINATNTPDKIWYVPSNYGTAEDDVKTLVVTPMLRGLEFNNNTFSIKSIRDYAFMYELFNSNAALNNGKYTYQIESNINLEYLSADRYKYKGGIAANITGKTGTYTGVTIKGSANSTYPTIYCPNFKDTFVTVEGFNAFGLFPYLTGSVSNLNIVASKTEEKKVDNETVKEKVTNTVNLTVSGNNNIATFGIVSGYVDIGTINNVNVYGYLEFTGTAKAFIGGAVGVLTGNSTAHDVTSAGSLTSSISAVTQNQGNYLNGNVIGGVVGYTDFALANVYTLLNSMNINTNGVSNSVDLVVGGVVGAGYTAICNNLQNEGTITIGTDDTDAVYNSLYVAGVFGRHLGQTEQVNGLTNYGNITVYNNTSKDTYVCGSVNATPITKNVANLEVNNYKSNGKYYYRATKIINGANITINKTSDYNHYTDVINVITNECVTRLSGVYNLAYSKNRGTNKTTPLGAKSISMNKFNTYSPVLNYEHSGSYDEAIISTVYNLRDINYTMDSAISTNVTYTGVIKGTNVSMIDVRNEGNLTFTIDKALTGNLNIFGIIEEISGSATASSLYNGGDIKVTYTAQITGNVNISGICYKNKNTSLNTSINNYNPNLDTFDANALGAMDSTINAGNIELTNTDYATGITYNALMRTSNNGQQYLAYFYNPSYEGSYIKGNINVAGITNINYSVITNTFNIGDVFVANVCKDNGYKINAAGITDLNIGQYAYILNSGNNGDIKSINLYNRTDNSVSDSTLVRTDLTAAGIIARNDLTDALSNYTSNNGHSKQVVAFTINYGSIYAYNYNENIEGSNQEPNCKAAGIVGMGLLSVVNVLNYGNIFGSETTSGIFGVVYFGRFQGEVNASNPVKIANTINYGNTFILYKGYNSGARAAQAIANGSYDHNIIEYTLFKNMNLDEAKNQAGELFNVTSGSYSSDYEYYKYKYTVTDVNEETFDTIDNLYYISSFTPLWYGNYDETINYYKLEDVEVNADNFDEYKSSGLLYYSYDGSHGSKIESTDEFNQSIASQYKLMTPSNITSDNFVADGTLFLPVYTSVENTEYNSNVTYYKQALSKVKINSSNYTTDGSLYAIPVESRINYANYSVSREVNNMSINGSIFSIINFNGNANAQYVTIRYLINFEEKAPLVGFEPATPGTVTVDRSTIYSAYTHLDTRNNGSGQLVRDIYMAYIDEDHTNYVVYAPLTDETDQIATVLKSNSTISITNSNEVTLDKQYTYNGVFSKNFEFYKAITKQYTKAEIAANPTDAFLSDFFQFVEYSYINEVLVDKIGWKEIAYATAANTFARSTANVKTLLNKLSEDSKDYSTYTTYALSKTSLWTKWASGETLTEVINELIKNNDTVNLEKMLEYIFSSDSKSNVLITKELREELYEIIVSKITGEQLSSILTKIITYENGYSKILADAILENNGDIRKFVDEYLKTLDLESIKSLLSSYIEILDNKTTDYFDYSTNLIERSRILNNMFTNINNSLFYKLLCDLLNISSSSEVDNKLQMYQGYEKLSNPEKLKLYLMIIDNNDSDIINSYLDVMEGEIGYYNQVVKAGYNTTNIEDTYNQISSNEISNESTTINERVSLWNQIKNTTTFKNYFKSVIPEKTYFLATEHRNTYQSNTAPSPEGATDGDLSYYYTPIVTPSTYFYGPYSYASYDGKSLTTYDRVSTTYIGTDNKTKTVTETDNILYHSGGFLGIKNPGQNTELYPGATGEGSGVWPVFIADNLTYFNGYYKKINDVNSNFYTYYSRDYKDIYTELGSNYIQGVKNAGLYLYEYGFTGANNQFCSGSTVDSNYYLGMNSKGEATTDFGGSKLKTSNATLTYGNNITIDLSNASISGHYVNDNSNGSFEIIDANGNQYLVTGAFSIYDPDLKTTRAESGFVVAENAPTFTAKNGGYTLSYRNSGGDAWGDVLIRYGRNYYFSFVDSSYHKTKRTGIYRYKSGCNNMHRVGISWFTQKPGEKPNITWTTQYIDYSREQLLSLDGIYTNFSGNPISEDERNIINSIFNYYFIEDSNTFNQIIRKSLLELIGYDTVNSGLKTVNAKLAGYNLSLASLSTINALAEDKTVLDRGEDWYESANEISGSIYYYRNYNSEGMKWVNTKYKYDINLSNISFNNSGNLSNYNLSIVGTRGDTDISNYLEDKNVDYNHDTNILTITFRSYTQGDDRNYYDDITVPVKIYLNRSNSIVNAYVQTSNVTAISERKITNKIDNWFKDGVVSGTVQFYRWYPGNSNTKFSYAISMSNLTFNNDNLNQDYNISIVAKRGDTDVTNDLANIELQYDGSILTLSFQNKVTTWITDTIVIPFQIITGTKDNKTVVNTAYVDPAKATATAEDNTRLYYDGEKRTISFNDWMKSENSLGGSFFVNRNYTSDGEHWNETLYRYDLEISSIDFVNNVYNVSINGYRGNTDISNNIEIINIYYESNKLYLNFRTYINGISVNSSSSFLGHYWDNIEVSFNISRVENYSLNVDAPYTIDSNGLITILNTSIATVELNSNLREFNGTVVPYSNDYYIKNIVRTNNNKNIVFDYIDCSSITTDYIAYIDDFVLTNINSSEKFTDEKSPFEYLNYTSVQSVKSYLLSKSNNSTEADYKTILISNAISNEKIYYGLLKKLLELDILGENVDLSSILPYKLVVGSTTVNTYSSIATYRDDDYSESFITGFSFLDDVISFELDKTNVPGILNIIADKHSESSGSFSYTINYKNEILNENYESVETVDISSISRTAISISEYVPASNVTSENYSNYYLKNNDEYSIATEYDSEKDYYFKTNSDHSSITVSLSDMNNVTFYNINQFGPQCNSYYYYFTDSVVDNKERFSNGSNPNHSSVLHRTYHLRTLNEIYELMSGTITGISIEKVEIEVVVKTYSGDNTQRFIQIEYSDSASYPTMKRNDSNVIFSNNEYKNTGFRFNTGNHSAENGFYIGGVPGDGKSKGEVILGHNAAISLLTDYTTNVVISDESALVQNHKLKYFNNLDELQSDQPDLVLNLTENPNNNKAGDTTKPGSYYMVNQKSIVDNFSYPVTDILGQYLHAGEFNKEEDNSTRYPTIQNVMYKVTYKSPYKISDYIIDDDYLNANFYYDENGLLINHKTDFASTLANLLPICTDTYADNLYVKATVEELNNNFDNLKDNLYEKSNDAYTKTTDTVYDSTKTYYKLNDLKNYILKYLNDNPNKSTTITIDGKQYKLTIEDLYKLLICYSNESFINFLKASYTAGIIDKTKYTLLLEDLLSKNAGYTYISDVIDKYHKLGFKNSDMLITAAALASDYENQYQQYIASSNSELIADSKLKALLEAVNVTYEGTSIQYINNDGSFDNDKFDALLDYIGLGGNNDVYGIYALSSSKGIKNGDFIPDNLNLESHNAYYKAGTYGLELLLEDSSDYAYWRKQGDDLATKYGDKYTGDNATTYSDSVNYAFLIEMKQLQKSIATTLFELDLNTSVATSQLSDYTMYSSQSLINEITKASDAKEKNHYAITYYVPSVYLNDIIDNNKDLEIVELIKSSSATVYTDTAKTQEAKIRTESIAGTKFSGFVPATSLSSNTNYRSLDGCYVLENAIIIRAEDERVYSYYDILLRPMDFSFDMQYQQIQGVTKYDTFSTTSATVASTDGVISLNLTSPVIYVNTTDTTAKPGAVYYTRTGTEGNYVYTKADLTVGQSINPNNYYSTYTKAVEADFREGITYYTKSGNTYTEADLTNHVITDNTYYIASEATKLPTGFDLAPYVKIRKQGSGGASIPNSFTLLNEAGNHVVKADGSADITLEILDTLEAGNYDVVVDLYGAEVKLPLTKLPNENNDFTAVYDGKNLAFTEDGDNYIATTEILWGQPFAKYALLDLSYLDSFTKSPNSTVEVTTEYNVTGVNGTNVNYDIATYTVKIDVTSESGVTKHYQHKLVEMDPFRTKVNKELVANDLYATLYEDGVVIGNAKLGEDVTDSDKWTVKDNIMNVSFSRDKGEPNYRAKYSYKNIYYSLNNKVYSYEEYDTAGNIINTESSVKILYAGFNVVVTSACDTGTYTFGYVMNNPTYQEIDYYEYDEENNNYFLTADILAIKDKDYYTYNIETDEYSKATLEENAELAKSRKLVFPKLRIEKTPSLNALVESATFIDGYEALGALATLVYPDYSIVPSNQVKAYNNNEPIYSTLIDSTQKISVDPTDRHITYEYKVGNETTNYAETTNNYYIVGTTSDASLERYAPTITLQDDYAKLFRFVSPYRNSNYDGKKEATDYSILNNHDDNQIYLYVPFEIDGEEDVLMVKVNVKDMSYEEVWDTSLTKCYARYNKGDGTLKKDGENPTPYKGKELYDITFEYDGHTYKVSHYAGSVSANNSSLFDSYAEECENSRFWYVSYVVFSEDFFMNGLGKEPSAATNADWGNRIKYYNVAIIDVSNNIRFILEVDAPVGFKTETNLESIYTTFAYNKYSSTILTDTKQLSAYVEYKDKLYVKNGDNYVLTTGALDGSTQYYFYDQTTKGYIPVEWSTKGTVYDTYVSNYGIQLLPTAYYRFNLDLPSGYVATYKASKVNTYNPETSEISEDGSYLPPSSIVTQTIKITITIERGNVENTSSWGISTSNVTTIVATEKTN